ncbi:hypothetical protein BZA77DRAFT_308789 [Pyronema omphalodes]|nr:hypothetical protein BZA77DRAFT_308789 [Pyronema omphalodes]
MSLHSLTRASLYTPQLRLLTLSTQRFYSSASYPNFTITSPPDASGTASYSILNRNITFTITRPPDAGASTPVVLALSPFTSTRSTVVTPQFSRLTFPHVMYDIISTVSVLRAPVLFGHETPIGIYASRYLAAFSISAALTESGNFINAVAAEKPIVDLLYDGEISYNKWTAVWNNENAERTAIFGSNPKTYYADTFASPLLWFMTPGMKFPASETVPQDLEVEKREGKRFPPPGFLPGVGLISGNLNELKWKKPKLGISLLEEGRQRMAQEIFAGTADAGVAEDEKALSGWLENVLRGNNEGAGMDFTYRKRWKEHGSPKNIGGHHMQQILRKEPPIMISEGPLEDAYDMADQDIIEDDDSWESDPGLQLALSWLHGGQAADQKPIPSSVPGFGIKPAISTFVPRYRPAPDSKSTSLRAKPLAARDPSVWGSSANNKTSSFKAAPKSTWNSATKTAASRSTSNSQPSPETNTVSPEPKPSATPKLPPTWGFYQRKATTTSTPRFPAALGFMGKSLVNKPPTTATPSSSESPTKTVNPTRAAWSSAPTFKTMSSNSKSPANATSKVATLPQEPKKSSTAILADKLASGSNKSASKVSTASRMAYGMSRGRSVAPSKPAMPAAPSAPRRGISAFQGRGF